MEDITDLIEKAKNSLSIITSSTTKDGEIEMWTKAAIADLERQGIKAKSNLEDLLIQSAVILFVKSNFGNTEIKEKELAEKTYSLFCTNLSLSEKYKKGT